MYPRQLGLKSLLEERSLFLFGARQTGKTTLARTTFPNATFYSLLEADTFRQLAARPELLRRRLGGNERVVVIDEIQRLPALLSEVHRLIEQNGRLRFLLTGSSARSLRRGGVNLLGGRAGTAHLFPLVAPEAGYEQLDKRLSWGSLPAVLDAKNPEEQLKAYVGTYLQEEIRAEGLVRSLEVFTRFLDAAALANGQTLNFARIGEETGVPARTVREYFYLLADTLIGSLVEAYQPNKERKAVASARFYLFDVGVANHLSRRGKLRRGSAEWGQALRHLIFLELSAYLSYRRIDAPVRFWATHTGFEVDFVVGEEVAIDVKPVEIVGERALRGLRALGEEGRLRRRLVVSLEPHAWKSDDGIEVFPVEEFLRKLWGGRIVR
jgi:predicted AAA+ superfamily ATPase